MTEYGCVGLVGLGSMGLAMATNLVSQGFSVRAFDIADGPRRKARALGIEEASSLSTLVEGVASIILSLPNAQIVSEVVEAISPELSRRTDSRVIVIDTSTSEPAVSRTIAERLRGLGHGFLDAPVSGGAQGAAAGKLTMMIGGAEADLEAVRPLVENMTQRIIHVGPSGAGNIAKLANNLLVAAHFVVTREALGLAQSAGLEPEAALRAINASSGRSMVSEVHFPTWVVSRRFDSGFSMGLMRKDIRMAMALAGASGQDLVVAELCARLWNESDIPDEFDFTWMGAVPNAVNEDAA